MELELSRRAARRWAIIATVILLGICGRTVTPVDGSGEPLVLSPAYVATVRYLQTAQQWVSRLEQVDIDLAAVMEEQGNFYQQGRNAERAFESAASIAREIAQAQTPPALAAVQETFAHCAAAYVQVARAVLVYVSAPTEENRQVVNQEMEVSRTTLEVCQEALWAMQPRN